MTSLRAEPAYPAAGGSVPNVPARAGSAIEEEPPPREQASRISWIAAGSSFLIHLVLLLIMTAWLLSKHQDSRAMFIQSRLGDDLGTPEPLVVTEIPELEIVPLEPQAPPQLRDPVELAEAQFEPALGDIRLAVASSGGGDARSPAAEPRSGRVEFFGTGAEGRSFIFVVDSSGSMEGSRFRRAVEELRDAIRQLGPDQEFFIVFYNNSTYPLFYPREFSSMIQATQTMRKRAIKWIRNRRANGGTRPEQAVRVALSLQPDIVYFLTDGEIPPETRTVASRFNVYKSVIHTIAFESRAGEEILKGIAADNNGRYRFVD